MDNYAGIGEHARHLPAHVWQRVLEERHPWGLLLHLLLDTENKTRRVQSDKYLHLLVCAVRCYKKYGPWQCRSIEYEPLLTGDPMESWPWVQRDTKPSQWEEVNISQAFHIWSRKWQSNPGGRMISTKSCKNFSGLSLTCPPSSLTPSTGSKVNMRCPFLITQWTNDWIYYVHISRYYILLAKRMMYLCFYLVLTQVEMFRKNTLKLWEFAERKLDSPFRCRDIQVSIQTLHWVTPMIAF